MRVVRGAVVLAMSLVQPRPAALAGPEVDEHAGAPVVRRPHRVETVVVALHDIDSTPVSGVCFAIPTNLVRDPYTALSARTVQTQPLDGQVAYRNRHRVRRADQLCSGSLFCRTSIRRTYVSQ